MTKADELWEKYRGHLMLEHEFLAALKEYGEAVRAEAEELRKDAKQEWVGLAGDEILDIVGRAGAGYPAVVPPYTRDLFKKIEDKLREKNG